MYNKDVPLYLSGRSGSPFLVCRGCMATSDQSSGLQPEQKSLCKLLIRKGTTPPAEFLRNPLIIPSGPDALPFFNVCIALYTSAADNYIMVKRFNVFSSPHRLPCRSLLCHDLVLRERERGRGRKREGERGGREREG